MNKDFITYELALKLKEKGYPQDSLRRYDENGNKYLGDNTNAGCCAPRIAQVLRWLREEKKIFIDIRFNRHYQFYKYHVFTMSADSVDMYEEFPINTYEQAALAGIEYVLDDLI